MQLFVLWSHPPVCIPLLMARLSLKQGNSPLSRGCNLHLSCCSCRKQRCVCGLSRVSSAHSSAATQTVLTQWQEMMRQTQNLWVWSLFLFLFGWCVTLSARHALTSGWIWSEMIPGVASEGCYTGPKYQIIKLSSCNNGEHRTTRTHTILIQGLKLNSESPLLILFYFIFFVVSFSLYLPDTFIAFSFSN